MKLYVVFCSDFEPVYWLAEAIAEGARSVDGADVEIFRAADFRRDSQSPGATRAVRPFDHVPFIAGSELAAADAIVFGTPAEFGVMAAPMRALLDQLGPLWMQGALIGKVGSVFTSTTALRGGHESTVNSFHVSLVHLGMIIVGVPYCENRLLSSESISGSGSYGMSDEAGVGGQRRPSATEIAIARFQGQHVAEITQRLLRGGASLAARR
ncbi:MAG: NAD(P)H:quinone oxidoreductase [Myxococcota bacterium]|jgi:NAD(P)H dehydrogenase (quinone)|nr:NAD(P)H:quinone oxidoreductase [Myxococcota bacterium]